MPTYGYRCKSCAYEFDEFQKITDAPLVHCPSCKKETLVRIIGGGAGLVFKGSGFYLTDYKKKTDKGGPTNTPEKKDTKSEPKADAKTEPQSAQSKSAEPAKG